MNRRRVFEFLGVLLIGLSSETEAQIYPYPYGTARLTRGSYGPGMSFGAFGMAMNRGEAYGNVYGGLGRLGTYGFGYGAAPGFGPSGAILYNSAYNTPGVAAGYQGFYPPWSAYGYGYQNPAIFGPPAPNWGRVGTVRYYRPIPGRVVMPR